MIRELLSLRCSAFYSEVLGPEKKKEARHALIEGIMGHLQQ